jgi:two-component system KDP operon response regulator KdpE
MVRVEYGLHVLLEALAQQQADLLLLDDLTLCAPLRQRGIQLPIVVLSSSDDVHCIVRALDQGADDYVIKPFGTSELLARLRAHLRRAHQSRTGAEDQALLCSEDGSIRMHVLKHQVFIGEHEVHLTPTEFALLRLLMTHAEHVLPHRTILQRIWGSEYSEEAAYVRGYVRQLRCKVEPDPSSPRYIVTEPGVGYVFRACGRAGALAPGCCPASGAFVRETSKDENRP